MTTKAKTAAADAPRMYVAGEYQISSQFQPELHERIVKLEATISGLRSSNPTKAQDVAARLADDVLPALVNFASAVVAKVGNTEVWIANLDDRIEAVEEGAGGGLDPDDAQVIIDGLVALAAVAKSFDLAAIGEENAKVVREALEKGEKALATVQEYMGTDEDEDDDETTEES